MKDDRHTSCELALLIGRGALVSKCYLLVGYVMISSDVASKYLASSASMQWMHKTVLFFSRHLNFRSASLRSEVAPLRKTSQGSVASSSAEPAEAGMRSRMTRGTVVSAYVSCNSFALLDARGASLLLPVRQFRHSAQSTGLA